MAETLEDSTLQLEETGSEKILKNTKVIKYSKKEFFKQESTVTIPKLSLILDQMKELYSFNETTIDIIMSHCKAKSHDYKGCIIYLTEYGSITFLNVHATFDTFEGDTFNIKLEGCRIKFRMAPIRRLKKDTNEVSYLWGLYSYSRTREISYSTPKTVTLRDLNLFLEYFKEELSTIPKV